MFLKSRNNIVLFRQQTQNLEFKSLKNTLHFALYPSILLFWSPTNTASSFGIAAPVVSFKVSKKSNLDCSAKKQFIYSGPPDPTRERENEMKSTNGEGKNLARMIVTFRSQYIISKNLHWIHWKLDDTRNLIKAVARADPRDHVSPLRHLN